VIPPGSALGLLGGGQLGRMFTAEAARMGYPVVVIDPDPHAPAALLAHHHLQADWTDPAVIEVLRQRASVVTTEFENVPADVLRALAAHLPVHPGADAVAVCQDRAVEKRFLQSAQIPTVPWAELATTQDIEQAWQTVGGSAILKTSRLGYDGKGQVAVSDHAALSAAWDALGRAPCVLERRVALAAEVSVMVARGTNGAVTTWPVGENVHVNGILHTTVVPARVSDHLATLARETAIRIANALGYVGVLGVECFVTTEGELLVNEIAPRPHNSGHWTLEGSATSQFEQQVRAITGLPLGDTSLLSPTAMVNILGDAWQHGPPRFDRALAVPGVHLHLYGKREPRPGRKMGHLTALAESADAALEAVLNGWASLTSH
jgi:5-(carboxyamino)imidazole ribonucleotide synthase